MKSARSLFLCLVTVFCSVLSNPVDLFHPEVFEESLRAELEEYRLNDDVLPSHYDIELTPYFEDEGDHKAFTFDGEVFITLRPTKAEVKKIDLHVASITIESVNLKLFDNSKDVKLGEVSYNNDTEILSIPVNDVFAEMEDYLLIIRYIGVLGDDMRGFYRSYYKERDTKIWLASTQFQTTSARRAFPCFDEPKFKATFQLKINRPYTYRSFSNTKIMSQSYISDTRIQDLFEETPVMSTYLVAFIVADYIENTKSNMGILARPEAWDQTKYSLQVGIDLLHELEMWIDYPYSSVPSMDRMYMAAIPDFSAGAMENWGLLTYRETNILYHSDDSTSMQQQRIAAVIAHEIAHQWFGDLVTCEWWDVTWLNEGFARYFQYYGTALVEDSWNLPYQFVIEQLQGVMQMDSLESTHPMTHDVYTPAQVSNIFDSISYNKGAVVLRMVEHILSTGRFKAGLAAYIKERAFKTTRPENLFAALNMQGNPTIGSFMKPWTVQAGYPLVSVIQTTDGFSVKQKRFLLSGMAHEDKTLWPLPITYATKSEDFDNTKPSIIVETEESKINVTNPDQLPYFILNNQQVGYYRVNYDAKNWEKINKALKSNGFGGIHVLNRAQIVDDLFNLARAGEVKYETALEIIDYLQDETEYPPWLSAVNGFTILSRRIHHDDEELFAQYILHLFRKVYSLVKFQEPAANEDRLLTYLRINVLQWACNYGLEACKKDAAAEFKRYFENRGKKVHPDIRQVVYCEGIRQGTEEHFSFLWNQYLSTNVATEQILILQGLGCAKDKQQIHTLMDAIISDNIRPQDKSSAFSYLLANPYTLDHLSEYLRTNYTEWAEAHGSYMNVASAFNSLLARMKTAEQISNIETFATNNKDVLGESAYNSIQQGISDVNANQKFIENNREVLKKFLKERASGASTITISLITLIGVVIAVMRKDFMFNL
ncbi:membrane alanyl aminopeptidase-like [Malaya genurostris]|uniref:membrane alanyl aminopeptidase-like n=1 Tax=Malaya genurostris TaxID=325434 RepID=UPI0026F39BD1|nr:membrane alanyl aminopeptidase-like [Malaya genurostris]